MHIGARIASLAGAGEACTSSTIRDLVVGSGLGFEDAGERDLKRVPGSWRVLRVTEAEANEAAPASAPRSEPAAG